MERLEHFLVIHNDYLNTSIGLFSDMVCIDLIVCENKHASKMIFVLIDELLQRNNKTLSDCAFIGVNQGPGPFTTLRVSIAAANGLAYSTRLPLVGINSIDTCVAEYLDPRSDYTVVISNAFCNDVYYAITSKNTEYVTSGCMPGSKVIEALAALPVHDAAPCAFTLIGNYAEKYKEVLADRLQKSIFIPNPCPTAASLEAMGKQAYYQWKNRTHIVNQLLPIYLKDSAPEQLVQ